MSHRVPTLPPELYRDVVSTLDISKSDARNALLSLALSSKHLCHESQRVLFERNDVIAQISRSNQECVMRHHQFVQAIFNHPARFGAFVRTFVQVDISIASSSHQYQSFRCETKTRERLWELTVKTLPYLINLKVLIMTRNFLPGPTMVQNCDFQLDFLQYQPSKDLDNLLSVVLPTQRRLLHLSLYSSYDQNSTLLADDNSVASLISVECDMHLLGRFSRIRNLIAISLSGVSPFLMRGFLADESNKSLYRDALLRLKYFKISAYFTSVHAHLNVILEGATLKIEILELDDYNFFDDGGEELLTLSPLPELHVLSLRFPRSVFPAPITRISGARKAFRLYPKLHQGLFWDDRNGFTWVCSKPQEPRTADADEGTEATLEDDSEGASGNHNLPYANTSDRNDSHSSSTDKGAALCWEKKIPATRVWGTLWWKICHL